MAILDHTIVPAHDKEESARFFARIFGVEYHGAHGHFAPVQLNGITFDFDNSDRFESHHYAFYVSDEEFDAVFGRIKAEGIAYGSQPRAQDNMEINHRLGGRGLYFRDANGHSWEILTRR